MEIGFAACNIPNTNDVNNNSTNTPDLQLLRIKKADLNWGEIFGRDYWHVNGERVLRRKLYATVLRIPRRSFGYGIMPIYRLLFMGLMIYMVEKTFRMTKKK